MSAILEFVRHQRLPADYVAVVEQWFLPLTQELARHSQAAGRPLIIGINGSQGSGKSTLAALLRHLLAELHGLRAIDLSIDDFYLTREQRQLLAQQVHPLLMTRGVPGTHDIPLLDGLLRFLSHGSGRVAIPRFDKAKDDRQQREYWSESVAPVDLILLEGWCLGTKAQETASLETPVNALERTEDADGSWRRYVNARIHQAYQQIYDRVDIWIMLQAPSFDSVFGWRLEQEQKLAHNQSCRARAGNQLMSEGQVRRFIQFYQRLTEHALRTMPEQVHYLFPLDSQRRIRNASRPRPVRLN